VILAVDVSNDAERSHKFYSDYGFTIPALLDVSQDAARGFGVEATPTNYLIDATGNIVWRHYGFRRGDEEQVRAEILSLLDGDS